MNKIIESLNLNITRDTLSKYFKNKGISNKDRKRNPVPNISEILDLYNLGESICKLAKLFKYSKDTISSALKELGVSIENHQIAIKFDETIFDSIDTEEKAYWLGFIYADGNIKSTEKTTYRLTITLLKDDYKHLVKFNTFTKHLNLNIKLKKKLPKDEYTWYACSKHLLETLNNYGCTPNKSLTLQFPDESVFKDKSLIRHFIRGYFDGDGCLSYDKQKEGIIPRCSVLGTKNVIEGILKYTNLSDAVVLEHKDKNIVYNLKLKRQESILFLEYLYSDCNIYLDRKYSRFTAFKNNEYKIKYDSNSIEIFNLDLS